MAPLTRWVIRATKSEPRQAKATGGGWIEVTPALISLAGLPCTLTVADGVLGDVIA